MIYHWWQIQYDTSNCNTIQKQWPIKSRSCYSVNEFARLRKSQCIPRCAENQTQTKSFFAVVKNLTASLLDSEVLNIVICSILITFSPTHFRLLLYASVPKTIMLLELYLWRQIFLAKASPTIITVMLSVEQLFWLVENRFSLLAVARTTVQSWRASSVYVACNVSA